MNPFSLDRCEGFTAARPPLPIAYHQPCVLKDLVGRQYGSFVVGRVAMRAVVLKHQHDFSVYLTAADGRTAAFHRTVHDPLGKIAPLMPVLVASIDAVLARAEWSG
jgi:hypothetical protein